MTRDNSKRNMRDEQGATLVEFALVLTLVLVMIFGLLDVSRLLLVYATTANAASAGLRYAVTHGAGRTIGASGPAADPAAVIGVIQGYSTIGTLETALMTNHVNYLDGTNTVGSRVQVIVSYPYTPMVALYPLTVTVGSTTQGTITCCE
jgi:Flp pilus assembly protein TadG